MTPPESIDTIHKREFRLTVEFTNDERIAFFERGNWSPQDDNITDALISEFYNLLDGLGLRATVEEVS